MNILKKIRHGFGLHWAVLSFSRRPDDVRPILHMFDHFLGLGGYQHMERIVGTNSRMKELMRDRVPLKRVTLAELDQLPEGSLGKAVAKHLIANHLDLDFYPNLKIKKDEHYVLHRIRAVHDALHVVTGFDTTRGGEVGIQAFTMAQTGSPFSMFIVGGAIFFAPFKSVPQFQVGNELFGWMDRIATGWNMGKNARFYLAYDWDRAWTAPIDKVREDLGICPFS